MNHDIIFLQETHCHLKKDEKKWGLEWDGKTIWSRGTNRSRGVSVLFNRKYKYDVRNTIIDCNGRYIVFDLYVDNVKYRLINIYAPNDEYDRVNFFNKLHGFMDDECENLIAGDYNCAMNSDLDRENCIGVNDVGQIDIKNLCSQYDLEDIWRRRNPNGRVFSWRRGNKASRIDYWLISRSLDNQVDKIEYSTCPFSDHDLVNLKFRMTEIEHGKGLWKMNAKIIKSQLFQDTFRNMWVQWEKEKTNYDILKWWDLGKKKIKEVALWASCKLSKDSNDKIIFLENRIKEIENKPPDYDKNEICNLKKELSNIYEEKGKGAKIRSRTRWFEEGEMSTKYFHGLEKSNAKDKAWSSILNKDGNIVKGNENIMQTQVDFYKELYTSEGICKDKADKFLNSLNCKLEQDNKDMLDKDLSLSEMHSAISKMNNNKSPGPDGIIVEFYKLFFKSIGESLLDVFKYGFENRSLPYSQYLAVIVLLYKKGNREDLKNWRPISLLNVDAKILSKVLAARLKLVLPKIIHVDQKGCIQGRFIGENIRLIEDVIESCNDEEVVIFLDQQKAFDKVEWEWLFLVLKKFGFGDNFISWINIIYTNMKSAVLTNGYISGFFNVSRGIRQGDSLSALLYVIQSEPLGAYLRQTSDIKGITVEKNSCEKEVRCCFYVDDGTVFLSHFNMITNCLSIFDEFGEASGASLNKEKTVGLIMKQKVLDNTNCEIKLTMGPEKALGIPVGKNLKCNKFWENLIEKMKKKLNTWKSRDLSFTGKVHIIKSLGVSIILYACDMKSVKDEYIECINKLLYDFLWSGKRQIPRNICTLPKHMGGIGMIDINTIIKAKRIKWVIRVLKNQKDEAWKITSLDAFKCLDKRFDIEFFSLKVYDSSDQIKHANISAFYKECILSFQEMCQKARIRSHNDIVWCNDFVIFKSKPLIFSHWSRCGLKTFKDIIDDKSIKENHIFQCLENRSNYIFEIRKLKTSIPNLYLENTETTQSDDIFEMKFDVPGYGIKNLMSLCSKDIYNILLLNDNENVLMKSKIYWENKFRNEYIDFDKWFSYNFISKITPRKCLDFNWKIFHGHIFTEKKLSHMNFSDGICKVCNDNFEDIAHLLSDCNKLKGVWNIVENMLKPVLNIQIDLFTIIAGFLNDETPTNEITNMLLSMVRWIIWKRRNIVKYEKTELDTEHLIQWIKSEVKSHLLIICKSKIIQKNKKMQESLDLIAMNLA